jgi:hypothetical protein
VHAPCRKIPTSRRVADRYAGRLSGSDCGRAGARMGDCSESLGDGPFTDSCHCVVIGEGCSGGAIGIGVGDAVGMLEHAYYSVISPEGCSSILWKDVKKNAVAAEALKMQVEDLLHLGVVDRMIPEPLGGAHFDPKLAYLNVRTFIKDQWELLKSVPMDVLLENRYQKFRKMGKFESVHETAPTSGDPQ